MSNVHRLPVGWQTVDPNEYDPDKKYTAASDNKGHSGWVKNLRVPSDIVGQIAVIVESGFYDEYTTQSALVRDALHHHLQKLNEELHSKNLARVLSLHRLDSQVQQRREEAAVFTNMMSRVREEVAELIGHGAVGEAKAFIAQMMGSEEAVPERFHMTYEEELKKLKTWADNS